MRDINTAGSASKNSALTKAACKVRGGEYDEDLRDCRAQTLNGMFWKFLRACQTEGKELWGKEKRSDKEEDWEDIPGRIWADCGYDNGDDYSPTKSE